jgi:hypothetical protein
MWEKPLAFMGLAFMSDIIAKIVFAVMVASSKGFPNVGLLSGGVVTALAAGAVSIMMTMLFQGTITYTIFQLFMEGKASVWKSLTRSLSRVLSVFLATLTSIVGGGIVCLGTVFILPRILGPLGAVLGAVGTFILLYFFFTTWFVFAPACVVERLGAFASLDRSGKLTKGYRLKISEIMMLLVGASKMIEAIAERVIPDMGITSLIVTALLLLVPLTFSSLTPAVVYYSLRVAKENLTPESLADIFD